MADVPNGIVMLQGKASDEWVAQLKRYPGQRCPLERFMSRVRYTPYGCWEWTGPFYKRGGYGKFSVGRRRERYAHRWAYFFFKSREIPVRLHLDHLCRNPCCVNPNHLECVTTQENTRRGLAGVATGRRNRSKAHCRHGHSFSGDNLYLYPNGDRGCRACQRAAQARYAAERKVSR